MRRHAKAAGVDLPRSRGKGPGAAWDVDAAIELARGGRTAPEIAARVGVSSETVRRTLHGRGVCLPDGRRLPGPRRTSDDVVAKVVALYTGEGQPSPPQIARQLSIMPKTVRTILDREGIPRRDGRADYSGGTKMPPPATPEQLQRLYSDLGTIKAVAQHLDIGQTTAGRLLRAAGVQLRSASEVQKGRPGRDGGARTLAQEITAAGVTAAQVRDWARHAGLPIATVGLPSRATWRAYRAANLEPSLPARLSQYVRGTFPADQAQEWLTAAPQRARQIATQADDLTLEPTPHPDAGRSLVWPARDRAGKAYMVRVDLPGKLNVETVQHLASLGVTPELLVTDTAIDASVVEFVHGRGARAGDLADTTAVAQTLRRMTDAAPAPPSAAESFTSWVTRFQATAAHRRPDWTTEIQEAADAVRAAHAATTSPDVLLHGDLVPANVIITDRGQAVLIDAEPHIGPIERDAVGWAHRSAHLSTDTVQTHLAVLEDQLDLDPDLCAALLRFCEITYQAYRSFRDDAPTRSNHDTPYTGKAPAETHPPTAARPPRSHTQNPRTRRHPIAS